MGEEDYLRKAYALFLDGEHDHKFFYIGVMWHYMYIENSKYMIDEDVTEKDCWNKAIAAYRKSGEIDGLRPVLYENMAYIYDSLGKRE